MPGIDMIYDREHGIRLVIDHIFGDVIESEQLQEIRKRGW
jgi:hypothetical protein